MLAKELRDNAQECLDWARTAHSEREREISQTWLELAVRAEDRLNQPETCRRDPRSSTLHQRQ